jgi:hypothetical protein
MTTPARLREIAAERVRLGRHASELAVGIAAKLRDIDARWDLDVEAKHRGKQLVWDGMQAHVAEFDRQHQALTREYNRVLEQLTAAHVQPPGVEAELLRTAAWDRLRTRLDRYEGPTAFREAQRHLDEADRIGDTATLQAARRELGAYLAARHGEDMPAAMKMWLDARSGVDSVVEARVVDVNANRQMYRADIAVGMLAKHVANRQLPDVLPSMTEGAVVFTDPDPATHPPMPDGYAAERVAGHDVQVAT